MARAYFEKKLFVQEDVLPDCDAECDNCRFENCDFSRYHFEGAEFSHCEFYQCDFSMAVLDDLALHHVNFMGCKLVGVDFGKCSQFQFSARFEDSLMDYAVFHRNNLKKFEFVRCRMREAAFSECDLSLACFDSCDLDRTVFSQCNLEGADLRSALHFSIDPRVNRLRKACFAMPGVLGLLDYLDIRIDL